MDAGELVPDEVVMGVIEECLAPTGPLGNGFVLDGFRARSRKRGVSTACSGRGPCISSSISTCRARSCSIASCRRVCEDCQTVYHVNMPPKEPWVCDNCGGKVKQRDDDTEEAVERRLQLYEEETVPIIDYYREQGILVRVDGVGEGDEVFGRLTMVADGRVRR